MGMSEQEKADYLASITPDIEAAVDAAMLKLYGRTYRGDAEDLQRAARLAQLPHGSQNGDGAKHPPESWQQIKTDFPDVFGGTP